jgi:tetratricopeptide (TPR) repeat protein
LFELNGALATMEAHDGNRRKANRLRDQSLIDPAENAIAQAAWLSPRDGDEGWTPPEVQRQSSDANAWIANTQGKWTVALHEARQWHREEPSSSRSANLAGYLAALVTENFEESEAILRQGVATNQDAPMLFNNLAFALANLGRPEEAAKVLKQGTPLISSDYHSIVFNATRGLIAFRAGDVNMGRSLYMRAIGMAARNEALKPVGHVASIYYALRETLDQWSKEFPMFSDADTRCKAVQDQALVQNSLRGNFKRLFPILFAKNNLGYKDKYEVGPPKATEYGDLEEGGRVTTTTSPSF